MADENRLAVPSYDESVVSDYIRNRVEPPADIVDGREIFKVEAAEQPEGDYEADLKKLQALSEDELVKLFDEVEQKSKEGRGLFSKGNLLHGYVIDPETLESLESTHHDRQMNVMTLADKIANKMGLEMEKKLERRIVYGLIYLEVPNLKTPVAKLYLGTEEMDNKIPENIVNKIAAY